jgi:hypothetical protein
MPFDDDSIGIRSLRLWLLRNCSRVSLGRGMPFDQDHVCPGGAVAHFARFAVLFAIEPLLRALRRFEFEHNDALRFPVAFQHFRFAAADDVFAAVLLYGRAGELFVFVIPHGIDNVDFNDDVGGHWLQ